jgi:hypothetical protein
MATNAARAARTVAFTLCSAWIVAGPLALQVFGTRGPGARYLRSWEMFGGRALGVIEARFFERGPDGTLLPLDRFQLLGHPDRHDAPESLRVILGEANARDIGRRLCKVLGRRADVRIVARRSTAAGWVPAILETERICPEHRR